MIKHQRYITLLFLGFFAAAKPAHAQFKLNSKTISAAEKGVAAAAYSDADAA